MKSGVIATRDRSRGGIQNLDASALVSSLDFSYLYYKIAYMTRITTIRIPVSMDRKIQSICESKHLTKSKLFREAMQFYIDKKLPLSQPISNTDSRFGKYGSGTKNRSTQYKTLLKAKLHEKNAR